MAGSFGKAERFSFLGFPWGKIKPSLAAKLWMPGLMPRDRRAEAGFSFLEPSETRYGGDLLKTRKGRSGERKLDTQNSMHLVLRSSKARGPWSFLRKENQLAIQRILRKFSGKYGVRILSLANVGNHLHLQIQLTNRFGYEPFIKAVTGAIAMAITGINRWTQNPGEKLKFWDLRPFTRVIYGFRGVLNLRNYIAINRLEGMGIGREKAEALLKSKRFPLSSA